MRAEILAAAVQDNKRGKVVGERTYGDAAQRKAITMDDGGAIILSVAKYYSPDGKGDPGHRSRAGDGGGGSRKRRWSTTTTASRCRRAEQQRSSRRSTEDDPVVKKALEVLK